MPTPPKKLTLQDAAEALRRIATPTGPTPTQINLDAAQRELAQRQLTGFRGVMTGDYPMPGDTGQAAVGRTLNDQARAGFAQFQADLAKRLLPPEGVAIPKMSPLTNLARTLWGSPGNAPGWEAGKGVGKVAWDIGKSLYTNLDEFSQAVLPTATAELHPNAPATITHSYGWQNLTHLAKSVPFLGMMVDPLMKEYETALGETPYVQGDHYPGAKFRAALTAAARVGMESIGTPIGIAMSGEIQDPETGQMRTATPSEMAESFTMVGLMAKGGRDFLSKRGQNIITTMEGDPVAGIIAKNKAQTAGEIASVKFVEDLQKAQRKETLPQPAPAKTEAQIRQTEFLTKLVDEIDKAYKQANEGQHTEQSKTFIGEGKEVTVTFENPPGTPAAAIPGVDAAGQTRPESLAAKPAETPTPGKKPSYSYPSVADTEFDKLYREADAEIQKAFSQPAVLTTPALKDYVADVLLDPIKNEAAKKLVQDGSPVSAAIFETVNNPSFKMNVPRMMEERGLTPEQAQKLVAGSMERTGHFAGQELNVFSQALDELEASLQPPPATAPLTEMLKYQQQVKQLQWWQDHARLPEFARALHASGVVQTAAKVSGDFERLRIGAMLSRLPTTIHIIKSQGLTSLGDIFDAFNTGLVNTAMNPVKSFTSGAALRENWADLIGHGVAIGETIRPGGRALTNQLLEANPMVKNRLVSGLMGENDNTAGFFAANVMRARKDWQAAEWGQKGAALKKDWLALREAGHFASPVKSVLYDIPMAASDILTMGLRAQEVGFRKFAFRARLEGNLRRLGVPTEDLLPMLQKAQVLDSEGKPIELLKGEDGQFSLPEGTLQIADIDTAVPPAIREALVDAEVHALRSTWAATPDGWMGKMLQAAKMWNSVSPIQTSQMFTPFVRAMANNIMWQLHHSPANLTDLLLPEYRAAYEGAAADGMTLRASRDIQRKMGESLTGVALLTASLNMAAGGQSGGFSLGPKPWIWTSGSNEQGDQQTYDIRQYPQLAEYSTLAAMIQAQAEGKPNPVSALEALEIFGNTRVGAVPVFNVLQQIRNAASANDEAAWEAKWRELGQLLAPFGNIPQTLREDYGRMVLEFGELATSGEVTGARSFSPTYTQPDTQGQSPLQGVGKTSPQLFPTRVSPFTGQELQSPSALAANSPANFPESPKSMTPMEWLLTKTPGLTPSAITKTYRNPEAQRMVNIETGRVLNDSTQFQVGGYSLQEYARILNKLDQPELSKFYMDLFLPAVRKIAEVKAMVSDMQASGQQIAPHFISEEVEKLPTGGVPNFRLYWEELLKAQLKSLPVRPGTSPLSIPSTGVQQ